MSPQQFFRKVGSFAVFCGVLGVAATVQAGAPQLDTGKQTSNDKPYSTAQSISNVFESKAVYGKLEGDLPVDIYDFTADRDGDQTVSLIGPKNTEASSVSPVAIFVDKTDSTKSESIQIPFPDSSYHASRLTAPSTPTTYWEGWLFQQYAVYAKQKVHLKKGATYYLVILDSQQQLSTVHYALKFGDGSAWGFRDVVTHFPSWYRVLIDAYGATNPVVFTSATFSFLLLLLGVALFSGIFLIQEAWALVANRSKSAGYLLVKLQPFSRITIWVSLWLILLGGYLFFDKKGWIGLPIVIATCFIPLLIAQLYGTFRLSPRLAQLEITKREVAIPYPLRKRWFFAFLVSLFSWGAFLAYLTMYLVK